MTTMSRCQDQVRASASMVKLVSRLFEVMEGKSPWELRTGLQDLGF